MKIPVLVLSLLFSSLAHAKLLEEDPWAFTFPRKDLGRYYLLRCIEPAIKPPFAVLLDFATLKEVYMLYFIRPWICQSHGLEIELPGQIRPGSLK